MTVVELIRFLQECSPEKEVTIMDIIAVQNSDDYENVVVIAAKS